MLHRRLHVRLLSSAAAAGIVLATAGCASSAGKTGPIPEALTGTWTCTIDAEQGKHVGSVGDADDTALWYYGGDRYTVTIEKKTWKLEGKQNGKDVTAAGGWGKRMWTGIPQSSVIDYAFWSPERGREDFWTSFTLGAALTQEAKEIDRNTNDLSANFFAREAKVTVSASKISAAFSAQDGSAHVVECSR